MRIGKKRAKFTIRIYDNKSNKTKSFVFDNKIKNINTIFTVLKTLLENYYSIISRYKNQHTCQECGLPYGTDRKQDNGKCPKCTYKGGRNKR